MTTALHADNARFDLEGPKIDIRITRGSATLPISEVPNLQGDIDRELSSRRIRCDSLAPA